MLNNVVVAICQALPQYSIAAFRFNFRGVGGSEGSFGEGIAEQEDVKAALDFIASTPDVDSKKIGLTGYSFGARVALPVALRDERVNHLALVSPPLSDEDWEQLKEYRKPKFLIVGDVDSVVSLERFEQKVREVAEPKQCQVVPMADHFWWSQSLELGQEVTRFFVDGFNQV